MKKRNSITGSPLPIDLVTMGLVVAEEMSFENVDGRRTDDKRTMDACLRLR